jgi:mannose-1-phosphate guanylyltransferase
MRKLLGRSVKVVVLDCGLATRAWPLTFPRPKSLLTVANTPVLTTIVSMVQAAGINDAVLCLRRCDAELLQAINLATPADFKLDVRCTSADGSVRAVIDAIGEYEGTVLVVYGDNLIWSDQIATLLDCHWKQRADATILTYSSKDLWTPTSTGHIAVGVLETAETGQVLSFDEKPTADRVAVGAKAHAATFAVESSLLRSVPDNARDFSRDVFERGGLTLWSVPIGDDGFRHDVGFRDSYLELNLEVLRGNIRARVGGGELAPGVWASGEQIPRCIIRGRAAFGRGVVIHETALIEDSVIGDGATIGAGARIKGSVIQRDARIENDAIVLSSVIGEGAIVRAFASLGCDTVVGPYSAVGTSPAGHATDPDSFNRRQRDRQQVELQHFLDGNAWTLRQKLSFLWEQQIGVFLPPGSGRVRRHQFMSRSGSAFLLAQLNERRTKRPAGTVSCPLCVDGRSATQQYYRASANGRDWHFLGNPFALGSLHFTVASALEQPQRWKDETGLFALVDDLWLLASQLPSFVAFYNGALSANREGSAGCSIERHLHIQVLEPSRMFPLQYAAQTTRRRHADLPVTPILDDYPLAAFRVAGSREIVVREASRLLGRWRAIAGCDATENILAATEDGAVVLYIVPRRGSQSAWGLAGVPGGLEAFGDVVLSDPNDVRGVAEQRIGFDYLYGALFSVRPQDADRLVA